jgi:hypothetical protein
MKSSLETPTFTQDETWLSKFKSQPFSSIPSNEWYGVKDLKLGETEAEREQSARLSELAAEARKVAMAEFIASDTLEEPKINYPNLVEAKIKEAETVYLRLLGNAALIDSGVVSDFRYEQAAKKLAELYRHLEVIRSHNLSGVKKVTSEARAAELSSEIFGTPEKNAFNQILSNLRVRAQKLAPQSQIAAELLDLTNDVAYDKTASFELKEETLSTIRGDLTNLFPNIESQLVGDDVGDIPAEDSVEYFQKFIDFMQMDGWKATLNNGRAADANASEQEVGIGRNRDAFTPLRLNAIMVHEVIGHGLRAFNASRQSESHKQSPTPGSLAFEEGFATGLEQVITGEKRIAGEQYYLSLGLQMGLDANGETRNFRHVYEILWRRLALDAIEKGNEPNIDKCKTEAYTQCLRTTRGGTMDTRDISYFEGAKKAYTWLNQVAQLPEEQRLDQLRFVLSGRFDPTNPTDTALFTNVDNQ